MRSILSGPTRANGPPSDVSFSASAAPVNDQSPDSSQRRAMVAQVSRRAFGIGGLVGFRLQNEIERHRQPRRRAVIADRRRIDLGKAIDQADFTAAVWCHIGAVHPVDDTGEHEAVACE